LKYTEEDYLNEPWFQGDESDIRCQTIKFVKVRKEHQCQLSLGLGIYGDEPHNVKKGSYAYYEKALVDGQFASYYMCTDCMDKWLDEINYVEEDLE
jgi:hypothetical protein